MHFATLVLAASAVVPVLSIPIAIRDLPVIGESKAQFYCAHGNTAACQQLAQRDHITSRDMPRTVDHDFIPGNDFTDTDSGCNPGVIAPGILNSCVPSSLSGRDTAEAVSRDIKPDHPNHLSDGECSDKSSGDCTGGPNTISSGMPVAGGHLVGRSSIGIPCVINEKSAACQKYKMIFGHS